MAGYTLSPSHWRRLWRAIHWYERSAGVPTGEPAASSGSLIPFQFRRFALKSSLAVNGSAEAYIRKWNGTAYASTTDVFTVHDACNTFYGSAGAFGYAIHMHDVDRWEVIQMTCPP